MKRYHPVLVAIHWLMAILILMELYFGTLVLAPMDNASPEKVTFIGGHMTFGLALGALLVLRLLIRLRSTRPVHASTGNAVLDRIGIATHWVLYALVAAMVATGLVTAFSAGLFPIAFGGSGESLPANLSELVPRLAHGLIADLLIVFVALHVAAALYHQFVLRDGLFRRMWFGKRA